MRLAQWVKILLCLVAVAQIYLLAERFTNTNVAVMGPGVDVHDQGGVALTGSDEIVRAAGFVPVARTQAAEVDLRQVRAYNSLLVQGEEARGRKDWAKAMEFFTQATALNATSADAWYGRACCLGRRDGVEATWEEREKYYEKAIALDPNHFKSHNNLGFLLDERGDMARAEVEFRRAIDIEPNIAVMHNSLGVLLLEKGDRAGAEVEFRWAIEIDPNDAHAHTNLGVLLFNKGDMAGAEVEYRRAIDIDPNNAAMHNNLGLLLVDKGDRAGAEVEYRRSIDIDPNDADAHYHLGNLLREKGDKAGAEAEFRRVVDIDPNHASAHADLGALLGT
jgi:Flp pilus assembly protein TadD